MARIKRRPGQIGGSRMPTFQRAMREEIGDFDAAQAELDALRGSGTVYSLSEHQLQTGRDDPRDPRPENMLQDDFSADISSTVRDEDDEEYPSMDEFLDLDTIAYRGPRQNARPRRRSQSHRMMRNPDDLDHFAPLKKRKQR